MAAVFAPPYAPALKGVIYTLLVLQKRAVVTDEAEELSAYDWSNILGAVGVGFKLPLGALAKPIKAGAKDEETGDVTWFEYLFGLRRDRDE